MEAEDLSKVEDRPEDTGSKNEGQTLDVQPDFPAGGQSPGPSALWDTLEKKFLEYQQLKQKSPGERRKNLLNILPLFLKAWEHSVGIICFHSLQSLAEDVSDQLAQEVQEALAGKPAEQARATVGQLLRWKGDVDQDGYLLLKSVYVLTGTNLETLGRVAESGLPALLLQCLYLFFAFPVEKDELLEADVQGQRMFVQMLLNLCSEPQSLEGLLSGSELQSLLIATTCLREHSSYFWKEPTHCVLRAISKAQSPGIIQYLHAANCIRLSVQNLSKLADTLPAFEVSEAVSLVLTFVKDAYPISSVLFLEFENGEGYPLLLKVLLRYDGLTQGEVEPHLEELIGLVVWLTTCGRSELKVFDSITYPQLEDFRFYDEAAGVTVKNLQAFQVLQNVFHKVNDSVLCTQVLLAIKSMWAWNPRNFFLLEWTLQPLSQFVDIVSLKPTPVQVQFFQLLETLVFKLRYVPHEILGKVQRLIKDSPEPSCPLVALQSLLRITGSDPFFTDLFRDSGLLGLLLAQLRKQAKIMRKAGNKECSPGIQDPERDLTCVMLNTVVALLQGSVRNAVVLKDHGMVPFIKIFLDDGCYRAASLRILEQLSAINAEEYMSIIIGALCSSTQGELQLKLDLLKSLLRILETPKGRAAFRVSSGFNGLLSLLSDLEGSLHMPVMQTWRAVSPSQTLELVLHTLCVVSAALHLDPVNGDFFRRNGLFEKLAEDLCLLGCFGTQEEEGDPQHSWSDTKARAFADLLSAAFSSSCPFPPRIQSCLQILSFLDSMASGTLHLRRDLWELLRAGQEPSVDAQQGETHGDLQGNVKRWTDPEERVDEGDAVIMLPGVVCVMVKLLPRLYLEDHPQLSEEIQCSLASHLLCLVKSEKNRQVMCEAGMLQTILTSCRRVLSVGSSPLHVLLIRVFEKLASQAIEPDVLRQFLGLGIHPPLSAATKILCSSHGHGGDPRCSGSRAADLDTRADGSPCAGGVQGRRSSATSQDSARALQTALSLISMTSPRNLQPQRAALAPSFVEFDMSAEGYGCLFTPTLSTIMGTSTEHSISGGTGTGTARPFPPPGGLTFSCWFLISRQGTVMEGHPLRFLTLVRHLSRTERPFVCFSVNLCPDDLSLVVSTEEKEFQPLDVMEPEDEAEPCAGRQLQVRCGQRLACGQWHHLAVVVSKEMKRHCTVSTYLDGEAIGSAKMLYIQALPGPFLSMDPSSFVDVYGYIGTPRIWKQKSSLIWRLGPAYLFEEAISVDTLEVIIKLGPRYCGNFQAVHTQGEDPDGEATGLVAEEKVSFGLHVSSSSMTSIADIRSAYNEVDSRLIAKEMHISSRDHATPVFLLRNCAGHLSGSLRTLGAVAVGQLGVRVFHSSPAASSLDFSGGPAILLGLISLATDDNSMYAAMKVLHSVLTSNAMCDRLMQHICGYQILAFLLRKNPSLLNHRIFQLILSVAGTAELGFRPSAITNMGIFQHVLCNFELWTNTADNLETALFSHILEILQSPREGPRNAEVAHQAQLIPKLVFLFSEPSLVPSRVLTIISILGCQLRSHFTIQDLLRVGLFVVYTLKPSSASERQICVDGAQDPSVPAGSQTSGKTIWLRNQLLEMLLSVVSSPQLHLSSESKEEVFLNLGPDWFLLLLQGHLHPSTTMVALKLLLYFLSNPSLRARFRDGLPAGCWVEHSMEGVDIVMDNLKSQPSMPHQSSCLLPGFRVLSDFLTCHVHVPEVYLTVSSFFLQTPLTELTDGPKGSLDAMLQWLLQKHNQQEVLRVGLCTEGALLLLEMLKATLSQPLAGSEDGAWEQTVPSSILHFLGLVYRSYPQDPTWRSPDFLQTLAIIAFPLGAQKGTVVESTRSTGGPGAPAGANSTAEGLQAPAKAHPARRQLREFIQSLLRELLLAAPCPKQWLPLEVLLEAPLDSASSQQKQDFQSAVLLSAMEIFRMMSGGSTSTLRGNKEPNTEAAALPPLANISYFTQKLVEKLYSGVFSEDARHILLFITQHILVVIENTSPHRDTVMSSLYSSLNKAILYCLSKPQQSLSECLGLLSVLDFLKEHWDIVFATYNSNVSFLLCLMHCLLLLNERSYPEGFGLEPKPRISPYHQVFLLPNEDVKDRKEDLPSVSDVQHNIQKSVRALWQQLVAQRRQTLEDTFKIDLSVKAGEREVRMEEVTPLWEETMVKAWQHYLASEKKSLASRSSVTYHSRVTSWSGSLSSAMKLMPGRQAKDPECRAEDFVSCIENYRRRGQELYASLYKDYVQRRRCGNIKAAKAWAKIQEQLFGELGLWGPLSKATPCSRWELDRREGPARMRKRIRRLSAWEALGSGRIKEIQDTKNGISQTNVESQDQLTPRQAESEADEVAVDCTQLTFFPALHESLHSEDFLELCQERQVILQELRDGEKVTQKVPLVIVQGHLVSEGILLFGQQHFYVCENFTLSPTGDVYCTRHCLSNISDPFIFNMCSKDRSSDHYSCQCHSYADVKELRQARFLLQDIALETFFQNGDSKLLVFYNGDRGKAFKSFCSFLPSLKGKGVSEEPFNLRKHPSFDRTMLQRWQKKDVSNFEYLMYLNTLAGRTYNDYMQYPVFPWVLADYTSETLNLTNPKTFRNLSKPMGAQSKERKLKFTQRFKDVEKIEGDMTVQCHYYTHYSSAIIVASYLVRMPPFTQAFYSLQGGSFDVADRMFHSVKSAWESASRENMSDVRELTPEFFYLPEFLTNCNAVEFGCMQDGTALGDVQLPPWADGDPRKFISLHRQALESDFVSANLHHWIDLIFGYKQQGPAAVEAVNTFHPYFYGDRVDLSSIRDPLIKNTILGFVSNFGQVPKQLFTKPHPARSTTGKPPTPGKDTSMPAGLPSHPQPFLHSVPALKPSQVTVKDMYIFSLGSESPKGAIGHIVPTEKAILAVEKNRVLLPPLWNRTFSWGFDDFSCCLGNYGSDKILMTFENLATWGHCLCAICPSPTMIVTSGASAVVCVWELSLVKGRPKGLHLRQALYGHSQAVTCLAASATYSLLVSGSQDRTCALWDLDHLCRVACLPTHREGVSAVAISDVSGTIVSCAGAHLSLWNVNGQPLASIVTAWGPEGAITCCCIVEGPAWDASHVVVTGSQDGMVRIWKTEDVKMCVPGQAVAEEPSAQPPSPTGHKWEKNLALCRELDVNVALTGKPSKASPALTALAMSRNQTRLLVGDEKGRIFCWSADG